MARIRTIKPEFWQDEKLATVSRDARLLFIGLFNLADDEGRMRGSHLFIRAHVFPYDLDVNVEGCLAELERVDAVQRYGSDGQHFIWLRNFNKHQKLDKRLKSQLPAPPIHANFTPVHANFTPASQTAHAGATPVHPDFTPTEQGEEQGTGNRERSAAVAAEGPPVGELQARIEKAWFDRHGVAFDWTAEEERAVQPALGKAKGNQDALVKRWGNALERTTFPTCGGIRDLVRHWNAYGTAPPQPGGKGRATEADRDWTKPVQTDASGQVVL